MKKVRAGSRPLFTQLGKLTTERRNPNSMRIDRLPAESILRIINAEDAGLARAVAKEIPRIARAVRLVAGALGNGGRLIYAGAGTSGRLGVLDASECPPTFGTSPGMVRAIMAGGRSAVFRSREGVEDKTREARSAVRRLKTGPGDVLCGIAASLRTPFVGAALDEAKKRGAATVLVTTNPASLLRDRSFRPLRKSIDVVISPDVGPEVVMGSTRMKSGTAQKMVLNMITTASMVLLGKVYGNMMVDLRLNSKKLGERARRVLMISTGVDYSGASKALTASGGHVKTAIVMIKTGVDLGEAKRRLRKAGGFVHRALATTAGSRRNDTKRRGIRKPR